MVMVSVCLGLYNAYHTASTTGHGPVSRGHGMSNYIALEECSAPGERNYSALERKKMSCKIYRVYGNHIDL